MTTLPGFRMARLYGIGTDMGNWLENENVLGRVFHLSLRTGTTCGPSPFCPQKVIGSKKPRSMLPGGFHQMLSSRNSEATTSLVHDKLPCGLAVDLQAKLA